MHAEGEIQPYLKQTTTQNTIHAILCDVGGVIIHKRRTSELQQWENYLGFQPMALPLAIWLSNTARLAALGQASVGDVWHEIQQNYALTDKEIEAFKHDFTAADYLDPIFVQFLHEVRKTRKIALLSNAWPDARYVFGTEFGLKH